MLLVQVRTHFAESDPSAGVISKIHRRLFLSLKSLGDQSYGEYELVLSSRSLL